MLLNKFCNVLAEDFSPGIPIKPFIFLNHFNNGNKLIVNGSLYKKLIALMTIKWDVDCNCSNSTLIIGSNFNFNPGFLTISMYGDNNYIKVGNNCTFYGNVRLKAERGGYVEIGSGSTIGSATLDASENSKIVIGKQCMISHEIDILSSDNHPIFEKNKIRNRINNPSEVYIGNHVWIGKRVLILKNSKISNDSVVGAGSVVNKKFEEPNIIIAGHPAKVIRKGIIWKR